jgi:hypothetical protein
LSKISIIGSQANTPRVLLESIAEHVDEISEIFVVAYNKDSVKVYASGELDRLATASIILADLSRKYIYGEE